jgi:hypothetical protein
LALREPVVAFAQVLQEHPTLNGNGNGNGNGFGFDYGLSRDERRQRIERRRQNLISCS